jgi:hypothetical protein
MRFSFLTLCLILFALAGCASPASATPSVDPTFPVPYPDRGPAPELTGATWLNTPTPLRIANLRGKVVLVDMWTFG